MAKKGKKTRLVYVLENGETYNVISDSGKYYICECGTQFRKSAKRGTLKKIEVEPENNNTETEG